MKFLLVMFIIYVLALEWRYRKDRVAVRKTAKRFAAK